MSFSGTKLWSQRKAGNQQEGAEDETPSIGDMGELQDVTIEKERYLFGDGRMFEDLGVHSDLVRALKSIGKDKATAIQAACFDTIVSGKDTVIAAETGSGKTLAYLLPIMQQLLERDYFEPSKYPTSIIMVPNKELSAQVLRMAKEVLDALKQQGRILTVDTLSAFNGIWPYSAGDSLAPNIAICTPTYLGNYIRGPRIIDEELFERVTCLVVDEADMILDGSYRKDVEKIMDAFKIVRRRLIKEGKIEVHTIVLQNILAAATLPTYGLRSTERYIEYMYPRAVKISNQHLHKHHPRIKQDFIEVPEKAENLLSDERVALIAKAIDKENSGRDRDSRNGTMVFVNTAEAAVALTASLKDKGISCVEFHKLVPFQEKESQLLSFRTGVVPVLICTDHAARGLDLSNVYHVIQAEFALNVVNHLHRIGRTSRAGSFGMATNFYDSSSKELVDSILSDVDHGKIDQSFSRRRGFRKNIRKERKREESEGSRKEEIPL